MKLPTYKPALYGWAVVSRALQCGKHVLCPAVGSLRDTVVQGVQRRNVRDGGRMGGAGGARERIRNKEENTNNTDPMRHL